MKVSLVCLKELMFFKCNFAFNQSLFNRLLFVADLLHHLLISGSLLYSSVIYLRFCQVDLQSSQIVQIDLPSRYLYM